MLAMSFYTAGINVPRKQKHHCQILFGRFWHHSSVQFLSNCPFPWLVISNRIMDFFITSEDLPLLQQPKIIHLFWQCPPLYYPGSFLSRHLSLSLCSHLLWLSLNSSSKALNVSASQCLSAFLPAAAAFL